MTRRWSKLKSRVEALWLPTLPLALHCNVWVKHTTHWDLDEPRHWITLGKDIIWDFPGPFMRADPPRGRQITFWEDAYGYGGGNGTSSVVATLLHQYLERDRAHLFDPFEGDHWELGDILRAADRRIGRQRLRERLDSLDAESPARRVLEGRLGLRLDVASVGVKSSRFPPGVARQGDDEDGAPRVLCPETGGRNGWRAAP